MMSRELGGAREMKAGTTKEKSNKEVDHARREVFDDHLEITARHKQDNGHAVCANDVLSVFSQ